MSRTCGAYVPVFLILTAAVACAPQDDTPTPGELPVFVARGPDARIGAVDDPDYAFGFARALAVGPDGRVYSLHQNDAFVRRWTATGLPDGQVGRSGEGPGEFQSPSALGFFGDSLWVVDTRTYRASYFGPDGAFLGGLTPSVDLGSREAGPTGSPPRPEQPLRDGTWYGRKPAWSQEIVLGNLSRIPHVWMDADGVVLDTLWVQEFRPTDILGLLNEDGRGGSFGPQPFGDSQLAEMGPDGLLTVVERRVWSGEGPAAVRVVRIDMAGDTTVDVSIPYEPRPLPRSRVDSVVDEAAERMFEFMSRFRPGLAEGAFRQQYLDATYTPDHLPAVRSLVAGADGSTWLQRFDPEDGSEVWWVVDSDGSLARQVHVPAGVRLLWVDRDRIWGVETDDLDVNYLVSYRVEPATGT